MIAFRNSKYSGFSRQHKISEYINDGREIYRAAWQVFKNFSGRPSTSSGTNYSLSGVEGIPYDIKIMGVSVSGLKFTNHPEPLLPQYKKPAWVVSAMDKINNKYGEFTIKRGRLIGLPPEWGKDTVGFGKMKEFDI